MGTSINQIDITRYLHEHIPLTAYMQVQVHTADANGVRLTAPLAPNINHQQTAFGGSAASLATLACWTLLHLRLGELPFASGIVVHHSQMHYDRPIDADFSAFSFAPDGKEWQRFIDALSKRGKSRIELCSALYCHDKKTARFSGEFVAIKRDDTGGTT
jgi:thioesterase domain-containing protein